MNYKKIDFEGFYENWTQSRFGNHDFLSDLYKSISLAKLIPTNKSYKKVLEIGCGFGFVLNHFGTKYHSQIVGLDISKSAIDFCNNNFKGKFIKHDIDQTDLPFSENSFDLVILADVLEHVKDPKHLMQEALRVGKEVIIRLPLQYTPKRVPDKNGHLHFWPYHTDALIWLKQFPIVIIDFSVDKRRYIYDIAMYHKSGIVKIILLIFRRFNQLIHIDIPREEGINVYAIKR